MKKEMFYSAVAPIFHNARELRSQPTDAERILWGYLRTKPKGLKFRRQHPFLITYLIFIVMRYN